MFILCLIDQLVKEGSQFIIATHSPILIGDNCDNVIELSEQVENG